MYGPALRRCDRFFQRLRADRGRAIPDPEQQPARSDRIALFGDARATGGIVERDRFVRAHSPQEEERQVRDALRSLGAWQRRGRQALPDLYVPLTRRRGAVVSIAPLAG